MEAFVITSHGATLGCGHAKQVSWSRCEFRERFVIRGNKSLCRTNDNMKASISMGLRAVENYNSEFTLPPQVEEVLVAYLKRKNCMLYSG